MLLFVCCVLFVRRCSLVVVSCWLLFVGVRCVFRVLCLLFAGGLLFKVCCVLLMLLFVVSVCLLFVACYNCSLLADCCLLRVVC